MRSLGVYWSPGHMRQSDLDYMRSLDPAAIRVFEADAEKMKRAADAVPAATLFPRLWNISEEPAKAKMESAPVALGIEHAQFWDKKLLEWDSQGFKKSRDLIYVVGINEPRMWPDPFIDRRVDWKKWYDATMRRYEIVSLYNIAMLDKCKELGLHACALNFSVGWPPNLHDEEPSYWAPFQGVREAIVRGNHVLCLHEYWYCSGPQTSWGWHGGRFAHNPWPDVRIVIGECGISNRIDSARMTAEGKTPGWGGSVSGSDYARQLNLYMRSCTQDKRIWVMFPFMTDYYQKEWEVYDTGPAHADILNVVKSESPMPLPLLTPDKLKPITDPGTGIPTDPNPGRDFIWPISNAIPKINQYWGRNPQDYIQFGLLGHNGLDFACVLNTPVLAIADGVVAYVGFDPGYGNYIRIYHQKYSLCSFYAHLTDNQVTVGQIVGKGQLIGRSGNTGNSTGPHLHLEIRKMTTMHAYETFNTGFGVKAQMDPFTLLKLLA